MEKRIVDIDAYLPVLRDLTEQGREVSLLITGNSMSPFLVDRRDRIFFKKPDRDLCRGDMVFYRRRNGQYVMHRICRVTRDGFDLVGDAQTSVEKGVGREQIFGLITRVKRKDRVLSDGNFCWEFFRMVWIRIIPLRPVLVRAYTEVQKLRFRFNRRR